MHAIGSGKRSNIGTVIDDEHASRLMYLLRQRLALLEILSLELAFVSILKDAHPSAQQRFNHRGWRKFHPHGGIQDGVERRFTKALLQRGGGTSGGRDWITHINFVAGVAF